MKPQRDVEKNYPSADFIAKLRRLADALEDGKRFEIEIAGERISVPVRATYNVEHERGAEEEEIESRSNGGTFDARALFNPRCVPERIAPLAHLVRQ